MWESVIPGHSPHRPPQGCMCVHVCVHVCTYVHRLPCLFGAVQPASRMQNGISFWDLVCDKSECARGSSGQVGSAVCAVPLGSETTISVPACIPVRHSHLLLWALWGCVHPPAVAEGPMALPAELCPPVCLGSLGHLLCWCREPMPVAEPCPGPALRPLSCPLSPAWACGWGGWGGGLLPGGKWAAGQEASITATSPLGQQRGSGPWSAVCVAVGWPRGTAGRHLGCLLAVVASRSGQDRFSFEGAQPPVPFLQNASPLPRGVCSGCPGRPAAWRH